MTDQQNLYAATSTIVSSPSSEGLVIVWLVRAAGLAVLLYWSIHFLSHLQYWPLYIRQAPEHFEFGP